MTDFLKDPPEPLPNETLAALAYLRGFLVDEISGEEASRTPKVAWKARVVFQCMVRRILDAADGTALGWNANVANSSRLKNANQITQPASY